MRILPLGVLILALFAASVIPGVALAQDPPAGYRAHVFSGTCNAHGEIGAPLSDLGQLGDDSDGATPAVTSYSVVPIALETLLDGQYAIDVHRVADEMPVSCGEIGGSLDANGALAIGLRPMSEAGFSGIAYLTTVPGNPAQTAVSVFLAETGTIEGMQESASAQPLDDSTYAVTIRREVVLLVGSLQRVDALVAEPQVDDRAWGDQLAAELTLWQILYREARVMTPPAQLADFHGRYLEALALLDSAAVDIFDGLESGDRDRLSQASDKIEQAVAALRVLDAGDTATPAAGT